jgi:tetratricopeptide (TPR) repeat protein
MPANACYLFVSFQQFVHSVKPNAILLLLIVCLFIPAPDVYAFGKKSDICGSWNNYCEGGDSSGGSSGGDGGGYQQPSVPVGPSPAELERRRQSTVANDKGVECANKEDYDCSIWYYTEALRLYPGNTTARANLSKSRAKQTNKLGLKYYEQGDWTRALQYFGKARQYYNYDFINNNIRAAKAEIKRQIEAEAEAKEIALTEEASREVDRILDDLSTQMTKLDRPQEGITWIKDVPFSMPVKPRLGPGEQGNISAGAQLRSAEKSGRWAKEAAQDGNDELAPEKARGRSSIGFDTPGYKSEGIEVPDDLGANPWKEPVITEAQRTPAVRNIEMKRDKAKQQRLILEKKLEELQSVPDNKRTADLVMKVMETKQAISNAGNQEIFYNFSIGQELKKGNTGKAGKNASGQP